MKDTGSTASTSLRIDNVTVNGDVIPEPGCAVLAAVAALFMAGLCAGGGKPGQSEARRNWKPKCRPC
jgi:hypothetical protein